MATKAMLAGTMLFGPAGGVLAQSSDAHTVTVPFAGASTSDGYVTASMSVTYAFIACQGEIDIAYSLNEGSAITGASYRLDGKTYTASGAPPQPSTIHFAGTVHRGPATVGAFADGLAGKSLGMGCFSGQIQKVANIADAVGPNASAAQVTAYLRSLSVQVRPGEVLRSAAQESLIRGELRRAEAEATAAARKAEQEAQAKARQESEQRAAAEGQADARRADDAARQASSASTSGGSYMSTGPASSPPPPPSREQRIADAIASDKVLADQRLVEQRAKFAQQRAAMADAQQRQNEAMIAAAPAALELAGSIAGALDAWDRGIKDRAYQNAQLKLVGKCKLANGMDAPKDGDIQLGVEITARLSKADCGENAGNRYKAFKLELPEPTRLQFTIRPASWHKFTSFQIDVRDLDNTSHMHMGWEEWGAIQRTNSKNAVLPAGIYIVSVYNGIEDVFLSFDLRVDAMSEDWKTTVVPTWSVPPAAPSTAAPASPQAASATAPPPTTVRVADLSKAAKPYGAKGTAYLGIRVAAGKLAVVTDVDSNGPAAAADIRVGDQLFRLDAIQNTFMTDVVSPTNPENLATWLARQRPGEKTTVYYLRAGQWGAARLLLGEKL
jgi:hypothetical protein